MIDQQAIRKQLPALQRNIKGTNASLWLDKYISEQKREDPTSRWKLINEVVDLPEPVGYRMSFERWQEMLKAYSVTTQMRRVKVKGRMIVGLGSESVLETSICLHRIYGMPYIPGSVLKGLAASYAHQYLGEDWQRGGKLHTIIFGNTDNAGYITFFDALYEPGSGHKEKALYPDVITVHHEKYYQDAKVAPSDTDDPNPIPFLSATGVYLLALAAPDFQEQTRWIDITFQVLAEALEKLGIGAKTSSGYGRMKFLDSPSTPIDPDIRKAEGYKKEIEVLKDVAGQILGYHQKWKQMASPEAQRILATAIVDKVHKAGREKWVEEKAWYKELKEFIEAKER